MIVEYSSFIQTSKYLTNVNKSTQKNTKKDNTSGNEGLIPIIQMEELYISINALKRLFKIHHSFMILKIFRKL